MIGGSDRLAGRARANVRIRLFAQAREAAGRPYDEVPGSTVADVLFEARLRYGDPFGRVLDTAAIWLNGEPCEPPDPVVDGDEIAILPPVSGGL